METKPKPSLCPWLGSDSDPQMRWTYATARHFCWSPQQPRDRPSIPCIELSMQLQRDLCLTGQHSTCPYYVSPPPLSHPSDSQSHSIREVCFFLGGKTGRFDFITRPTEENACYSQNAPKPWWKRLRGQSYVDIPPEHQNSFCLRESFPSCPFFDKEVAEVVL